MRKLDDAGAGGHRPEAVRELGRVYREGRGDLSKALDGRMRAAPAAGQTVIAAIGNARKREYGTSLGYAYADSP